MAEEGRALFLPSVTAHAGQPAWGSGTSRVVLSWLRTPHRVGSARSKRGVAGPARPDPLGLQATAGPAPPLKGLPGRRSCCAAGSRPLVQRVRWKSGAGCTGPGFPQLCYLPRGLSAVIFTVTQERLVQFSIASVNKLPQTSLVA